MSAAPAARPRARSLGVEIGFLAPGPSNTITDVPGVLVGHATVWRDEEPPPAGRGVARTGVTAIVPGGLVEVFTSPLPAATAVLNGAGELTGSVELAEWGLLETPIVLTATMQVGRAYDGVVAAMCHADPACGDDRVVIPVVGECDDSWLNDARRVQISEADVRAALSSASADPPALGAVGAGTGMITCGYKGGIGSASRIVEVGGERFTVGVLVLSNWGERRRLVIDGRPVGRSLVAIPAPEPRADSPTTEPDPRSDSATTEPEPEPATSVPAEAWPGGPPHPAGSCIAVVATDTPFGPFALRRLATRCSLGLARCGSTGHHGSGEIFVAFSTARPRPGADDDSALLDACFGAVVEATEEAVVDALFVADTVVGRDGRTIEGLPVERVLDLLAGRPA